MDSETVSDVRDIVAFVGSAVVGFIVVIALAGLPLPVGTALGIGFLAAATYASWRLQFLALGAGVYVGAGVFLIPLALILLTRSIT